MSKHLIAIKSEVLNEKTFRILRKYSNYLSNTEKPFESVQVLYEALKKYPDKTLMCETEEEYETLKANIKQYEVFINSILIPVQETA